MEYFKNKYFKKNGIFFLKKMEYFKNILKKNGIF